MGLSKLPIFSNNDFRIIADPKDLIGFPSISSNSAALALCGQPDFNFGLCVSTASMKPLFGTALPDASMLECEEMTTPNSGSLSNKEIFFARFSGSNSSSHSKKATNSESSEIFSSRNCMFSTSPKFFSCLQILIRGSPFAALVATEYVSSKLASSPVKSSQSPKLWFKTDRMELEMNFQWP